MGWTLKCFYLPMSLKNLKAIEHYYSTSKNTDGLYVLTIPTNNG